jgi:hypothetical protein
VGQNYSRQPYPTLVTAQRAWVDTFSPLVAQVGANP